MKVESYERTAPCLYCQEPFTFMQGAGRPKLFCKRACMLDARKTGIRHCVVCGNRFALDGDRVRFCSDACAESETAVMHLNCEHCRRPRSATSNPRDQYCSVTCQLGADSGRLCEYCNQPTALPLDVLRARPRFCNETCRTMWLSQRGKHHLMEVRLDQSVKDWRGRAITSHVDSPDQLTYGPLNSKGLPYFVQLPSTGNYSRIMRKSLSFWTSEGLPFLAKMSQQLQAVYYVTHGYAPIMREQPRDLRASVPLWELTPMLLTQLHQQWTPETFTRVDAALRKAADFHASPRIEAQIMRVGTKLDLAYLGGTGMPKALRTYAQQWLTAEAAGTKFAQLCGTYYDALGSMPSPVGLLPWAEMDELPMSDFYLDPTYNAGDYAVTQLHSQLQRKWHDGMQNFTRDTPKTIGQHEHANLKSPMPGTVWHMINRWMHAYATEDGVIRNVGGKR